MLHKHAKRRLKNNKKGLSGNRSVVRNWILGQLLLPSSQFQVPTLYLLSLFSLALLVTPLEWENVKNDNKKMRGVSEMSN